MALGPSGEEPRMRQRSCQRCRLHPKQFRLACFPVFISGSGPQIPTTHTPYVLLLTRDLPTPKRQALACPVWRPAPNAPGPIAAHNGKGQGRKGPARCWIEELGSLYANAQSLRSFYSPPVPSDSSVHSSLTPGCRDPQTDATQLPLWRYWPRQKLIPLVRYETPYLAWLQEKVRTPALDSYFAFTANLGTHTFFMVFLPFLFWCGHTSLGRAYVSVIGLYKRKTTVYGD